ncbi:MAG: NAD(P)H-hydrate dehydratase [Oscillospiraceae bacterium]|nr:NAD(P)H-hydrate dehydratase [Oscillospiraceae bacterium]
MFYATPAQMKTIEAFSDSHGVSYKQLMENAGAAAAELICKIAAENDLSDGILIICGKGNNGGDGFVTARNLADAGLKVSVVLAAGDPSTELAGYEYCELSGCGSVDVLDLNDNIDAVFKLFSSSALIVDAVYGTGFKGELPPQIKACFSYASRCGKIIVAMDVPSGGDCTTGEAAENTLQCDYTVTFGCLKIGMLSEPLKSLCGKITIADIGFTEDCFRHADNMAEDLTEDYVCSLFPERSENSYKTQFGRLLNIAGSRCMSGAALLSTAAALRSGVGLCTLASTDEVINRISSAIPEATLLPLQSDSCGTISEKAADNLIKFMQNSTAILIGSGLAVSDGTKAIVKEIIKNADCPVILDADGINCIIDCIDIIRSTKNKLIITPHQGELERLYKAAAFENETADRLAMATAISREYDVIVAAKGVPNYIVGDGKLYVCKAGNPGLSRGGSGDVLAGITAAFAAMGLAPSDAAAAAVFLHGKAADIAADKLSQQGMLPSDVINQLPYVFKY